METKIIATGSSGNCFLFNQTIIIDAGVPLKTIESKCDLSKVSHILLTHIHGDHFKETTIRNIHAKYKNIIFVCGEWLKEPLRLVFGGDLDRVMVIEMDKDYMLGEFTIKGVFVQHDVPNCGYRLHVGEHRHIHITDASNLHNISALNYDTATIECNYEDNEALKIINAKNEDGEFSHLLKAMQNHLSVYDTIEFCKDNSIVELTPIHIGNKTKHKVIEALKNW